MENEEQEQAPKTYTAEEVQAMLDKETGGLKAKLDELMGETKTAKQKARELEEAQQQNEEARLIERQEFKSLYEREQDAKRELQEKYDTFAKRVESAEIGKISASIAGELTRDSKRGELLAEKVAQMTRYSVSSSTFELGGIEVDKAKVLEHMKTEYPFLVDGNQSSGGGATGNLGGGAASKKFSEMNGAELSELRKTEPETYQRLRDEHYKK